MAHTFSKLANPAVFLRRTRGLVPMSGVFALFLLAVGTALAFFYAPIEHKQGASVRIMYVHVPAAWLALQTYAVIAVASFFGFVWRHRLADIVARQAAPLGLAFTGLGLITGALWGKTTWGVYWTWDGKLVAMLVLFFIYAGYLAIWRAVENEATAARLAALLAMIGAVNVPIIVFSAYWWDGLHQKASVLRPDGPSMDGRMLTALLIMTIGFVAFSAFYILQRVRTDLRARMTNAPQRPPGVARGDGAGGMTKPAPTIPVEVVDPVPFIAIAWTLTAIVLIALVIHAFRGRAPKR